MLLCTLEPSDLDTFEIEAENHIQILANREELVFLNSMSGAFELNSSQVTVLSDNELLKIYCYNALGIPDTLFSSLLFYHMGNCWVEDETQATFTDFNKMKPMVLKRYEPRELKHGETYKLSEFKQVELFKQVAMYNNDRYTEIKSVEDILIGGDNYVPTDIKENSIVLKEDNEDLHIRLYIRQGKSGDMDKLIDNQHQWLFTYRRGLYYKFRSIRPDGINIYMLALQKFNIKV